MKYIDDLDQAFNKYLHALSDSMLPKPEYRTDLKHMYFWYPYYAAVVRSIAIGEQPSVEKRKLKEINEASQDDFEKYSDDLLLSKIKEAHTALLKYLPQIDEDTEIPYRRNTSYSRDQYIATLIDHLRMHWEYLEKRARTQNPKDKR